MGTSILALTVVDSRHSVDEVERKCSRSVRFDFTGCKVKKPSQGFTLRLKRSPKSRQDPHESTDTDHGGEQQDKSDLVGGLGGHGRPQNSENGLAP